MAQAPYQTVPLQQRSFLQKIFQQQPEENAVIAVNNLLATMPIEQIYRAMILKIGVEYKIDINRTFPLNMEEFYAAYLNYVLRKDQIGYAGDPNLDRLQDILGLKNESVQSLHEKVGKIWYEKALRKCLKNGTFSHGEEKALANFARQVRLPQHIADSIHAKLT